MQKPALDDEALVSLTDLATMAGVSRPAVSNWRRRYPDFPKPTQESATTTLFRFGDLKTWMAIHKKPLAGRSAEQAVWTALNPARGVVLPEDAAEAGMATLGYAVAAARLGDETNDVLKSVIRQDASSLPEFLGGLAQRLEAAGLPQLGGDHFRSQAQWEDYAPFFQQVAGLALELGVTDVFEALLAASARGFRGAGEHSTPKGIARLLVALASPKGTVLDFACGQGTLLLSAAKAAPNGEPLTLVGRDINVAASRLARVRLLVHGLDADIVTSDTLHGEHQHPGQADLVLADPPFGLYWHPEKLAATTQLPFGTPPRTQADLAWVQHAIGALRPGGQALIVTLMGPLFRGGAEATIRRNLVRAGCVRAIVALPGGLYPHTSLPVAVLILGVPEAASTSEVMLVDASQVGTRLRGRTELDDSDILQIVAAVHGDSAGPAVRSTAVGVEALAAGDCSLMPARWTAPGTNPLELVESVRSAGERLSEVTQHLASRKPLPLPTVSDPARAQSSSLLAMVDGGLVTLLRPPRLDPSDIGAGDIPVIRPKDVALDYTVTPAGFIERKSLPRSAEFTQPGDVIVLTDGLVRAGVDRSGGAVATGPLQIVRPLSDLVSSEVLAALITYHGRRQAVGVTIPRINLKSLEIPLLDLQSTRRLEAALRTLSQEQRWVEAARMALDEMTEALVVGVSTGSLRLTDSDEAEPR
ncbi:N-6 DNA methylase [Micromonospora tulbaghiae]|uniref:N-6 DNA methylase n=1 Tax=Micromonospora tulbaghiae TaxID=479978 RepID=UPI0033CC1ED3